MGRTRATFRSQNSYRRFAREVSHSNPFFRNNESEEFLNTLLLQAENRKEPLKSNAKFWRAQRGHGWREIVVDGIPIGDEEPVPHPKDRMKPLPNKAMEGRANPKGIPYLYLSSDQTTAMSEVRPWKGDLLSLGLFRITEDLEIINCISDDPRKRPIFYFDDPEREPSPKTREKIVWAGIDRAFSNPISRSDNIAEYIPTQIIAGLFKNAGYDGIKYRSSVGPGYNLALFDPEVAKLISCSIIITEWINYAFDDFGSTYYIKENQVVSEEERRAELNKKIRSRMKKGRSKNTDNKDT